MQLMARLLSFFLIVVLLLSIASGQIGNAMWQHCAMIFWSKYKILICQCILYLEAEVVFVSDNTTIAESSVGSACVIVNGSPSFLDVDLIVTVSALINGRAGLFRTFIVHASLTKVFHV